MSSQLGPLLPCAHGTTGVVADTWAAPAQLCEGYVGLDAGGVSKDEHEFLEWPRVVDDLLLDDLGVFWRLPDAAKGPIADRPARRLQSPRTVVIGCSGRAVSQALFRSVPLGWPGCTASMMTLRRGLAPRPWRCGFFRPPSVGSSTK